MPLDDTVASLASFETNLVDTAEELEARRTIKECDKRIANFETALGLTTDPDTLAGYSRQIERARAEQKGAELRLRRLTTGEGMTEAEIKQVVASLADAVSLLTSASPEDRRAVYETARLEVLYDHKNRRAKLSVAPWVSGGVGGATLTQSKRAPWRIGLVAT